MRKDTKGLITTLIIELLLIESITWAGVNHWKVNTFLKGNIIFCAIFGFVLLFVLFINWAVERS